MGRAETDRESLKEKKVVITIVLLSSLLGVLLVLPLIGSFITRSKEQLTSRKLNLASSIDFWNPRYEYFLGSLAYFGMEQDNFQESAEHFRNALKLNPYHLYSWFSLARAYWMMSEREQALRIFDRLAEVNTMNRNVAWDAGVFLITKEESTRALKHLRRYLLLAPENYENVFNVCNEAGVSYKTLSQELLERDPALLDVYYTYLMKNNMIDVLEKTLDVTVLAKNHNRVQMMVCNRLIGDGYFKRAREVWAVIHNRELISGVMNGGFEAEMTHGCFDWMIYKGAGHITSVDERVKHSGTRSLNIAFNGTSNVGGFLLSRIIPVDSDGEYRIRAYAKADNITTSNGPYIDVRGYQCNRARSRSESMTGTVDWKEINLRFTVPEQCEAVLMSIIRDKSQKLNNKISGSSWFDDITMEKLN